MNNFQQFKFNHTDASQRFPTAPNWRVPRGARFRICWQNLPTFRTPQKDHRSRSPRHRSGRNEN